MESLQPQPLGSGAGCPRTPLSPYSTLTSRRTGVILHPNRVYIALAYTYSHPAAGGPSPHLEARAVVPKKAKYILLLYLAHGDFGFGC